jgi:hypothetical protein
MVHHTHVSKTFLLLLPCEILYLSMSFPPVQCRNWEGLILISAASVQGKTRINHPCQPVCDGEIRGNQGLDCGLQPFATIKEKRTNNEDAGTRSKCATVSSKIIRLLETFGRLSFNDSALAPLVAYLPLLSGLKAEQNSAGG